MMNSDTTRRADADRQATIPDSHGPSSAELHNDRTHDSTVDTDGKNHEAARIAGCGPLYVRLRDSCRRCLPCCRACGRCATPPNWGHASRE